MLRAASSGERDAKLVLLLTNTVQDILEATPFILAAHDEARLWKQENMFSGGVRIVAC